MAEFTNEEMKRMGVVDINIREKTKRGWTREQFKKAFNERGFTMAEFERKLNLPSCSVSLALTKRYPRIQKLISGFFNEPLHTLWPNQYLTNGNTIDFRYHADTMSDEELQRLNETTSGGHKLVVVSLPPGMDLS